MVCESDTEFRAELEAMLRAHDALGTEKTSDTKDQASLVGSCIGDYQVADVIGSGGMSVVYQGTHAVRGKVAIKVMSTSMVNSPKFKQRVDREAQILRSFNHPVLTKLLDVFEFQESLVIVMEFIDGNNLDQLTESQPLPLPAVLSICIEVAEFLSVAHGSGIIHRDLKPSNIMVTKSGRAKLIDFGIAHLNEARLTLTGELLGSPAYMAPEQWRGQTVSHKTDIWALGAVLHRLCCGSAPFSATTLAETADQVLHSSPLPWPSHCVDGYDLAQTDRLVRKMLEKNPTRRPDSANDVKHALEQIYTAL